ncbi:MAG: hypothetical protein LBB75_05510 [Oscillospiraceae bacterium]|jgi:hypothetical protein|nr:hypothetical protein [Oscillospiraceae bacterium]
MKKLLSIFLSALLLCGVMGAGLTAAAAPDLSLLQKPLTEFLGQYDLENLTEAQVGIFIKILETLKKAGVDYVPLLEAADGYLPFTVKAALHDAGLMSYPIWERDAMMYLVFRYLLFGWVWMEKGQSAIFPLTLFA